MLPSYLLAFILSTTPTTLAAVQKYTLDIVNSVIAPDGGPTRDAVLANGQIPGPLISVNNGDLLQVTVVNQLTDTSMAQGTSIHWHGLLQHRTAEMDGASWVTQCPIAPGHSFTYNISIQQTGTYWYHSHITTQYCDGLRGPLVVYDPNDPLKRLYDVDNENTVITLGDWLHQPSPEAFQTFENPESTLINGLGRLPGNSTSPLAVVNVHSGRKYRLRVVNTACVSAFNFSIDGHTMTLIETDGAETHPTEPFGVVQIFPGQRVSVILKATGKPGNYWIRAEPFFATFGPPILPSQQLGVNMGILRYKQAPETDPTSNQTNFDLAQEPTFIPLNPLQNISGTPDVSMVFDIGVAAGPSFTINGHSFTPPPVPVLLQILNGTNPFQLMPQGDVIPLPGNSLIELTIPGGSVLAPASTVDSVLLLILTSSKHPFHLHGHKFAVIRSAGSTIVNTDNPPVRDTVNTGDLTTDDVTIRFRTDNPGPWVFHCHIDFHFQAGLAVVFAEDVQGELSGPQNLTITDSWKDLCPIWDALTTGTQFSLSDLS